MTLISQTPAALNVGLESFNRSIAGNGGSALQLDWQPPGNADPALAWKLARLAADKGDPDSIGSRVDAANKIAQPERSCRNSA